MISVGLDFEDNLFIKDGLISVKRFYDEINRRTEEKNYLKSLGIKERLIRCASQYSFFAIRNTKQIKKIVEVISEILSETSSWISVSRQNFDYWIGKNLKKQEVTNALNNRYIKQIRERYTKKYPKDITILNRTIIQNYFNYLKKVLLRNIKIKNENLSVFSDEIREEIIKKYDDSYLEDLIKKFCIQTSSILTRHFKRLRKNKYSSKTKKQEKGDSGLSKLIYRICGTKKLDSIDNELWQLHKLEWMRSYRSKFEDCNLLKFLKNRINESENRIIKKPIEFFMRIFLNKENIEIRYLFSGKSEDDFLHFLTQLLEYHIALLIVEKLQRLILPEIRLRLLEISQNPQFYLKIPKFTKASIPLGLDDEQIYSLIENGKEVYVHLSFRPNQKYFYKITNPERYFKIRKKGGKPIRGVLKVQGGKLQLALPFIKRLPERIEGTHEKEQRILNCDLGLKTFATLSITVNGTEIDRRFLDQKQLAGPKSEWFNYLSNKRGAEKKEKNNFVNYKQKLIRLQKQAYELQARMAQIKGISKNKKQKFNSNFRYVQSREYWYIKREYKHKWYKIRNLHNELVHQIATRIAEFAKYKKVNTIRFEDLRWVKLSSKTKVGSFLSTWQVHWFFSQVMKSTAGIARRYGIQSELTNPYKSSRLCSKCKREGIRKGKRFKCTNEICGLQIDSDLNAARNLGDLTRKTIPLRL
ncbi:MAG: transposase [Candidatus Heimdallarchaeota archaeon]|nr:transposase [Candidatus Heimdallarchaeota archaeon]MCK4878626.1 transposase [Candidatus Heimdallarchaeota archaeon]